MSATIDHLASPALVIVAQRVESNIQRMLETVGDLEQLRPHLKTSKMPEVVRRYVKAGIKQFKVATLAELEMALKEGAKDVLLAHQPVGPNVALLLESAQRHPQQHLSTIVDNFAVVECLGKTWAEAGMTLGVYVDIDCGMHRSGIEVGDDALAICRAIEAHAALTFQGLHVYDGHLRQSDVAEREQACQECFAGVWAFKERLESENIAVREVVAGGTPTFPIHAKDERVICSPGTCVFWDAGYDTILPDMDFQCAAQVLTRVISKPGAHRLCLDLGHKAIAAENPIDHRVVFPDIPNAVFVSQSEEHLVIETPDHANWNVGDALLGIPWHICPTVALYDRATVIENDEIVDTWEIPARDRLALKLSP